MLQLGWARWYLCLGGCGRPLLWLAAPSGGTCQTLESGARGSKKTGRQERANLRQPRPAVRFFLMIFVSLCWATSVFRSRNWGTKMKKWMQLSLTLQMPQWWEVNQIQHPGVYWIPGRHGKEMWWPRCQAEGRRGPRFGKRGHHVPSTCL